MSKLNKTIGERLKSDITPDGYVETDESTFPQDWRVLKLSEVVRVFRGASPRPKGDPKYYGGSIPRLLIEDVTRDGKYVFPSVDSLTEEGAKKSRYVPKGTVVLSCSGTRVAIPGILGVPACIHDGFFGFDDYKDLLPEYLYYYFEFLHDRMQSSATTGGVFNNLTTQIMKEMDIQLPGIKEQEKIVETITTWNKAIELKEKLIEQKKKQKKGLMQKLLTGKVRLPSFEGKWETYKLNQILKIRHGKDQKKVASAEGSYPILGSGGQIGKATEYLYNKESVLIGRKGTIDRPVYMDKPFWTVDTLFYTEISKGFSPKYIYYLFNMIPWKQYNEASGVPSLSSTTIGGIRVSIPQLPLQKYIVQILSTADDELLLLENELGSLKQQKKGLMQLLLTGKVRVKV